MTEQLPLEFDAPAERCPHCGEELDELSGLDLIGNYVDWTPCCEGMRADVGNYGWEGVFGKSLASSIENLYGEAPVAIEDDGFDVDAIGEIHSRSADYLATFRPRIVDPTVAHPDGTLSSPKGWQARIFADVEEHHRHHKAPQGWKFGVECWNGPTKVGVATVGRPVSRMLAQTEPKTLEVTRVATWGDSRLRRNASSKLYSACGKTARKAGAKKLVTYTHDGENGHSIKASGFTEASTSRGGSWSRAKRARTDKAPTTAKTRWERTL